MAHLKKKIKRGGNRLFKRRFSNSPMFWYKYGMILFDKISLKNSLLGQNCQQISLLLNKLDQWMKEWGSLNFYSSWLGPICWKEKKAKAQSSSLLKKQKNKNIWYRNIIFFSTVFWVNLYTTVVVGPHSDHSQLAIS